MKDEVGFQEEILRSYTVGGVNFQLGLREALRKADALVVMFDLRWPFNILETALACRAERHLLWGHGLGRHRAMWPLRLAWIRQTDGVILYHSRQAEQLVSLGVPEEKVFVAPNAIALPKVLPTPQREDSILFVGRLQPRKRLEVLIDSFAILKADGTYPGLRLDIVGEGSERPLLENRVRQARLYDSVSFHGSVFDERRLGELFARALVYASPGWTGLGLLHAFGHGVPAVIGEGIPHPPEAQDLVSGVNGFRAPPNPPEFATALATIVNDPELRNTLGIAAAEFVRSHRRIQDMVDGFMEALT